MTKMDAKEPSRIESDPASSTSAEVPKENDPSADEHSLSLRQERVLEALLETPSIQEAAQKAEVCRQTIYNYMREPHFRQELARRRWERTETAKSHFTALLELATEKHYGILKEAEDARVLMQGIKEAYKASGVYRPSTGLLPLHLEEGEFPSPFILRYEMARHLLETLAHGEIDTRRAGFLMDLLPKLNDLARSAEWEWKMKHDRMFREVESYSPETRERLRRIVGWILSQVKPDGKVADEEETDEAAESSENHVETRDAVVREMESEKAAQEDGETARVVVELVDERAYGREAEEEELEKHDEPPETHEGMGTDGIKEEAAKQAGGKVVRFSRERDIFDDGTERVRLWRMED